MTFVFSVKLFCRGSSFFILGTERNAPAGGAGRPEAGRVGRGRKTERQRIKGGLRERTDRKTRETAER